MAATRIACVLLVCLVFANTIEGLSAPPRPCHYRVETVSCDTASAEAGAKVFIEVTGSSATCPWQELTSGASNFQSGQTDPFAIDCPCVGHYRSLRIKYESESSSTGNGSAWYPTTVGIREWPYKISYNTYHWEGWSSSSNGVAVSQPLTRSDCVYGIRIETGKRLRAATKARVEIQLYGSEATCPWRQLDAPGHVFKRGRTNYFNVTCPCLGYHTKLEIRHDNSGRGPDWFLNAVHINPPLYRTTVDYHVFKYKKWLNKKLPSAVLYPRIQYRFAVFTGKLQNADTRSRVQVSVRNSERSSRLITLNNANRLDFQRGAIDTFYTFGDAVGNVTQIYVRRNKRGYNPSWFLGKIIVHNRAMNELFTCPWNNWLKRGLLNCTQYV